MEEKRFVDYEELFENALNYRWQGWKNAYEVMKSVEEQDSRSFVFPNSTIKHLLQFLNNYMVEKRVKDKLKLKWNSDDHDKFYEKKGEQKADFIDADGRTYELKSRRTFESAQKIMNWYGADVRLIYCTGNDTLYEYKQDESFEKICELKAPYVNLLRYDNIERNIKEYWNLD